MGVQYIRKRGQYLATNHRNFEKNDKSIHVTTEQVVETILFPLRFPILSAVVCCYAFFLSVPEQTLELFFAYFEGTEQSRNILYKAIFSVSCLNFLCIIYFYENWYQRRISTRSSPYDDVSLHKYSRVTLVVTPILLLTFILAWRLNFGDHASVWSELTIDAQLANEMILLWFITLFASLLLMWWLELIMRMRTHFLTIDLLHRYFLIIVVPGFWFGLTFLHLGSTRSIHANIAQQQYDAFSLTTFLACVIVVCVGSSSIVLTRRNWPTGAAALAITIYIVGISWANLNNRYELDDYASDTASHKSAAQFAARGTQPNAATHFQQWLSAQKDWRESTPDNNRNEPYEVFLVAAQGGGLYAGYHTAMFLARLHDELDSGNSPFLNRLLTISGVSGGGIGSAVFLAAARALKRHRDASLSECSVGRKTSNFNSYKPSKKKLTTELLVRCFFRRDLLAPVFQRGLFRDIPISFVPRFIWPYHVADRGVFFEHTLQRGWQQVLDSYGLKDSNVFEGTLSNISRKDGAINEQPWPSLVLNTSVVEDGSRLIFAAPWMRLPSSLSSPAVADLRYFSCVSRIKSLSVARATRLSSGFPYIFPPALIETSYSGCFDRKKFEIPMAARIVDGGYNENSGLSTISHILAGLRKAFLDSQCNKKPPPLNEVDRGNSGENYGLRSFVSVPISYSSGEVCIKVRFHIVNFTHRYGEFSAFNSGSEFGEFADPLRTLDNARIHRGFEAEYFLKRWRGVVFSNVFLGDGSFSPPLGLFLSETTLRKIEQRSGGGAPMSLEELSKANPSLDEKSLITICLNIHTAHKLRRIAAGNSSSGLNEKDVCRI